MKRNDRRDATDKACLMRRDRYRKKLEHLLAIAEERPFLTQVWAVDAMARGFRDDALRVLPDLPDTPGELGRLGPIAPWHLEGLVNERLRLPPFRPQIRRDGRAAVFITSAYRPLRNVSAMLHAWEDAETGLVLERMDVLKELPRLTHRQFEWQRGFTNAAAYYRWAFLYGGPLARSHFERKTGGLTAADFILYGFVLRGLFNQRPLRQRHRDMDAVGFDRDASEAALRLLSRSLEEARALAKKMRKGRGGPAYQQSVLRVAPLITFEEGALLAAPLPSLISARVTSGLFYDHADAPSNVRNEAGDRFEQYVRLVLNSCLPGLTTTKGELYRQGANEIDGLDAVMVDGQRLAAVFECKARKMSFDARFSETSESDPGHDELAKGVFQLWRFFAHHRAGIASGPKPDPSTAAVLVTLDNWMQMSSDRQKDVLTRAEAMAARREPLIEAIDRRPIVFASINELEGTLARSDEALFLADLATAAEERFVGWMLPNIYRSSNREVENRFSFRDRMAEVLPWWDRFMTDRDGGGADA